MNIRPVSEWTLYKYRFLLAYSGLALLVVGLLALYPGTMPPGLSQSEALSVVQSDAISFTQLPSASQIVNLPYHLLQKVSVGLLGVTPYGVRLPSLIFAAVTILALGLIIRRWFKANVAVVAIAIIATSSWFLTLGRLGAPDIMIPFWTCALILSATYVSQQTKHWHIWKAIFGLSAALSLYTPYMAYLFIATLIATLAQPHLRYLIRQSSKVGLTIGVFFFAVLLVPLGWGIYQNLGLLRDILAVPLAIPGFAHFGGDLLNALSNFINPYNTSATTVITPLVSLSGAALIAIGGMRLLGDFHSVRAYVLLIWLALLIPIIGFNPNNLTVLFVPAMLVMTIGLNSVMRYWYRLFPLNPYARLFGLAPLVVLVFAIIQFNYQRYVYSMLYSPQAGLTFSSDVFMAQDQANRLPAQTPLTIVVSPSEQPIYQVIAKHRPNTVTTLGEQPVSHPGTYLVAESEVGKPAAPPPETVSKLLVNDYRDDSLRFRLYQ